MQKYLSFPISGSSQLVAIDGILLIEQTSTTAITITYKGSSPQDKVTITLGSAMAASDVSVRTRIQDSVTDALSSSGVESTFAVSLLGLFDATGALVTISGISTSSSSSYSELLESANDLVKTYTYLDAGTADQRISTVVYSSVALGLTATETFAYAGSSGSYRVSSITLS